MRLTRAVLVTACLCASVSAARAIQISDVAADYSTTDNPNGVWRYGWSSALGLPFVLSTDSGVREGLDTWRGDLAADGNPAAYHNGTNNTILLEGTASFAPGVFALHPGPGGEYAVARYVAPETGSASIASSFTGEDVVGTTTDVHVLRNGASIFDSNVVGFGPSSVAAFTSMFDVSAGDTIDFAVGFGNGAFQNDTTGLAATITLIPVPEPESPLLLEIGLTGLALARRRR
jgi:hypothetical protein